MTSKLKTTLAVAALITAQSIIAVDLTFELSEVTAREWKIGEKKIMRLSKFETIETPKLNLAIAHYGLKPEETTCLDFYDYRPVANSTNAHLLLLGHDIEPGKLVKVTVVMKTNDVPPIVNVVRENTNSSGKIIHNMYGYRLTPEGLTRTTENFVWEPKQPEKPAKKWFFFK
jgi:hypothetical protein